MWLRSRRLALLVVVCWTLSCTLASAVYALDLPPLAADEMAIVHLDVGQAMATLIVGPESSSDEADYRVTVLVDSGGTASEAGKDGGQVVLDALWDLNREYGIQQLDYFVLTHYDTDHYKGAVSGTAGGEGFLCAEDGEPGTGDDWVVDTIFIDHGTETTKPANRDEFGGAVDAAVKAEGAGARRHATKATDLSQGDISLAAGAKMTCAAANRYTRGTTTRAKQTSSSMAENDKSVGYLLNYGGFDYLILGDAGQWVEGAVASYLAAGKSDACIDVLNVSHHGSSESTTTDFVDTLQPEIAVISVGAATCANTKKYKHPTYDALHSLDGNSHVKAIYQTGEGATKLSSGQKIPSIVKRGRGDVIITTNGQEYRVWTKDGASGQLAAKGPYQVDGPCPAVVQ
jgi:beta-lactamase superfamily II metal-dependent hydrolase